MPNFDIYSTTAGSAVADTLQQILARRKEEERQVLLDKMAQEEHQSTLAARQEQMRLAKDTEARQKAASEAQIAAANEEIFKSKLGSVRRGTTPEQIGDEGLRQEIEKRGGFESIPVFDSMPEVGQEGLPTARMQQSYAGTTDEQNKASLETQFDELMMGTDDDQTRQALGVMRAGGPAIGSMFGGRKAPLTVLDEATGGVTVHSNTLVPEDRSVLQRNRPPAGPAGLITPEAVRIIDPKTNEVIRSGYLTPQEIRAEQAKGLNVENQYASTSPLRPDMQGTISSQDVTNLSRAYGDLIESQKASNSRWFSGMRDPSDAAATAEAVYQRLLNGVAAKAKADQDILEIVTFINSDLELASLPLSEVIRHPKLLQHPEFGSFPSTATEDDYKELSRLSLLFRGPMVGGQ